MRTHRLFAGAVALVLLSSGVAGAQAGTECDGSIRSAQSRARLGRTIAHAGLLTQLGGLLVMVANRPDYREGRATNQTGMHVAFAMQMAGAAAVLGSIPFVASRGYSATAVDDAIQQIKTGETTTDDILRCLGEPATRSFEVQPGAPTQLAPTEESWTYRLRGRSGFFRRTVLRTVTITFKDNLVSRVQIAESR